MRHQVKQKVLFNTLDVRQADMHNIAYKANSGLLKSKNSSKSSKGEYTNHVQEQRPDLVVCVVNVVTAYGRMPLGALSFSAGRAYPTQPTMRDHIAHRHLCLQQIAHAE